MGKRLIIPQADFTANAIPVAKAINGTTSPQYIYAANVASPPSGFDWDLHKIAIQVLEDGSITNLNLPLTTTAIPRLVRGGAETNTWLKEIDLTFLSALPLTSLRSALSSSTALERVVLCGAFPSLSGTNTMQYFIDGCSNLREVVIDKDFKAPALTDIHQMFYASGVHSIMGLKYLITSSRTSMASLFHSCLNLEKIDFSGCDTSNVVAINSLFKNTPALSRIEGINELDLHSVTNYSNTFAGAFAGIPLLDISNWEIAVNATTKGMFVSAKVYELNANCFTSLYGDITQMFYLGTGWNTIHLDNLNDVSAVTQSTSLFSNYTTGTPKVTIANVTNASVKTMLINALNTAGVGSSSNWHEATIDGVLCLVP